MYTNISIYILQKGKINLKTQTRTCTASTMIYNRCAASLKFDTVSANVTA